MFAVPLKFIFQVGGQPTIMGPHFPTRAMKIKQLDFEALVGQHFVEVTYSLGFPLDVSVLCLSLLWFQRAALCLNVSPHTVHLYGRSSEWIAWCRFKICNQIQMIVCKKYE